MTARTCYGAWEFGTTLRILLGEDDTTTRIKIRALLGRWGYDVVSATNGTEAWTILQADDRPTLAVLDWKMPGLDGTEICRRLRGPSANDAYVYVLLLTGNDNKEDVVAGLEAGADDYLTKPFAPEELQVRLRTGARIVAREEMLRQLATHDPLTQALNRRGIFDFLERERARSERDGTEVTVMLVDLDHFKRINDTYGHAVGDLVLTEVARRLTEAVRPYDGVGRHGGEEFLLVLTGPPGAFNPAVLGERVRSAIASVRFPGVDHPVTVSVGVARGAPRQSADALLRAADAALYDAKGSGRDCVRLASLSRSIASPATTPPTASTPDATTSSGAWSPIRLGSQEMT